MSDVICSWNTGNSNQTDENDEPIEVDPIEAFHTFLDTELTEVFAIRGDHMHVTMNSGFMVGSRTMRIGLDDSITWGVEFLKSIYGELEAFENYFNVSSSSFTFTVSELDATSIFIEIDGDNSASMTVTFIDRD